MSAKLIIDKGTIFGNLTVLSEVDWFFDRKGIPIRGFKCRCSCGEDTIVRLSHLTSGRVQRCGNRRNHGVSHLKLHTVWRGIRNRCYSHNNTMFHRYGGRGIIMCEAWKNDFMIFHNWCCENGWEEGLTIDRRDNDGNYEPLNCRFVSKVVNNNNQERNLIVTYNGEKIPFSILLRKLNLHSKYSTYHSRLKKGWPLDKVLSVPKLRNGKTLNLIENTELSVDSLSSLRLN